MQLGPYLLQNEWRVLVGEMNDWLVANKMTIGSQRYYAKLLPAVILPLFAAMMGGIFGTIGQSNRGGFPVLFIPFITGFVAVMVAMFIVVGLAALATQREVRTFAEFDRWLAASVNPRLTYRGLSMEAGSASGARRLGGRRGGGAERRAAMRQYRSAGNPLGFHVTVNLPMVQQPPQASLPQQPHYFRGGPMPVPPLFPPGVVSGFSYQPPLQQPMYQQQATNFGGGLPLQYQQQQPQQQYMQQQQQQQQRGIVGWSSPPSVGSPLIPVASIACGGGGAGGEDPETAAGPSGKERGGEFPPIPMAFPVYLAGGGGRPTAPGAAVGTGAGAEPLTTVTSSPLHWQQQQGQQQLGLGPQVGELALPHGLPNRNAIALREVRTGINPSGVFEDPR